jgi:hypothetical protein
MPFYGPLLKQGCQITLDWMAQYSLGMRAAFGILFGLVSFGTLRTIFFGDPRDRMLKRIGRVVVEVVFGPIAVIGTMFIINVLYYAPGALLKDTVRPVAERADREHSEVISAQKTLTAYKTRVNSVVDNIEKANYPQQILDTQDEIKRASDEMVRATDAYSQALQWEKKTWND